MHLHHSSKLKHFKNRLQNENEIGGIGLSSEGTKNALDIQNKIRPGDCFVWFVCFAKGDYKKLMQTSHYFYLHSTCVI